MATLELNNYLMAEFEIIIEHMKQTRPNEFKHGVSEVDVTFAMMIASYKGINMD